MDRLHRCALWVIIRCQLVCAVSMSVGFCIASFFRVDHEEKVAVAVFIAAPFTIVSMILAIRDAQGVIHREMQAQDDEWDQLVNADKRTRDATSKSN